MALTLPQPRPTSSFSGPLATSWGLVRTGRIRRAASELASASRLALTEAELVEQASLLVSCRLAGGDLAGATAAGELLEAHLDGADVSAVLAHLARGELAAALGDHERALQHFRRVAVLPAGQDPALPPWRAGAALALLHHGRRPEGAALAREQVQLAEEADEPWQLAIALRALAIADATANPYTSLRRARGLARAAGDLRLSAQVDTDLAGLLLLVPSADSVAEAVDLLRGGEDYAAGEGLWPLHARISRLLERAGERPRPLEGEALALLTQAEQRVARLAAQGLTNRQIADQLAVTVKGVEWHLSRVYRKLGIGSRDGLRPLLDAHAPGRRPASA